MSDFHLSEHLEELRGRVATSILALLVAIIGCFFFADQLYTLLIPTPSTGNVERVISQTEIITNESQEALLYELPRGAALRDDPFQKSLYLKPHETVELQLLIQPEMLYALGPLEGFFVSVKLALIMGLILSSPIWLYSTLRFILPALNETEGKMIPLLLALLLVTGALSFTTAKFLMIPLATDYFFSLNAQFATNHLGLASYVDYCLWLYISSFLLSLLILTMTALVYFGLITYEMLRQKRRVAYLLAFILGALLTPPDVFSQLLAAGLLILSYEGWLLLALYQGKMAKREI